MIINKKIIRTMMEKKSQYLGSLALIIISCMTFTMFNLLTVNMSDISTSFERDYVQEDASFITAGKILNISELESRFDVKMEETYSIDYPVSNDKTLRIFSQNTKVDIPAIIEGKNLSAGEILIDPSYAKANKLKIGDSIKLYSRGFKIAGFMSLPNYIYPLKSETDLLNDPNSFGIAVITRDDFSNITRGSSFYAIKFNGDRSSVGEKTAQLKDYLKDKNVVILKWTDINENPRVVYVSAKIDGIKKMSASMPIFILLLTCILTCIVMWRLLKKESVITGTLYALGYKKRNIIKHYLIYPLSISLIGGITGTILGAILLKPMLAFMVSYFNMPVNAVSFNLTYVVISILLPVLFMCISGYIVINRALKLSPVELMRGGRKKANVSLLERKIKLDRLKFKYKFRVREQLRSIPRSIFLLLGVMLATMLLLYGFAAKSSIDSLMKSTFEDTYKYNYEYTFNSLQKNQPLKGETFSSEPFTLKSDSKTIFAVIGINPCSKYISLKDKSGRELSTDGVIITRPFADKLKLKAGDTIHVVNKLDSREYAITINSVAETYVGEYIYMPLLRFNDMLKLPSGSYTGIWSTEKLDIPENMLLSVSTISDSKKSFESVVQPLEYAVGIMAFMSFIIGLIVIYVVTSLIIEENRENISLMKAFGYRKKEVNSLILNSSSFIVVIGYILGVPLLLVSLAALFKSVTQSLNFVFPITIDYTYVFAGFVVIYLTYEISKALSRRKVNRISMAEILKAEME